MPRGALPEVLATDRNLLVELLIGTAVLVAVANKTTRSSEWMSFADRHYGILGALAVTLVVVQLSIAWITGQTLLPSILWMLAVVPAGLAHAVYKARRGKSTWGM